MGVVITGVEQGSIAMRLGVRAGWVLERINGQEIEDVLDYRFHMTGSELELEISKPGGARELLSVSKGEYDDLGLIFATYLMNEQKSCRNRCVFCFIDQLPRGLRDSLYFKDDDERMSFLFGNYVTLTNLREVDIERILAMRISPVNVSVHTMNPQLRVRMMGNADAGKVLARLPRLAQGGIRLNVQLVICPGLNDGPELERSLRELCDLGPMLQSLAVVPVGLTKYRQGLEQFSPFTRGQASAVLDMVDDFAEEMLAHRGARTCYASDEMYLIAQRKIPSAAHYEAFDQLENGVGMWALLQDEFEQALSEMPNSTRFRKVSIATGISSAPLIKSLVEQAGSSAQVIAIENDFFGRTITVSGLVTGADLIAQLRGKALGEALLIPTNMLRREGDLFLDGVSVREVSDELGIPVIPVENDGAALLEQLTVDS